MASTYSTVADLLTGNVPLPAALSPQKFVDDAANEVDSFIGFKYQTPVDVSDLGATSRPARLLIKRLANFLATGRLLMAADASGQDVNLHAYANKLITDALTTLQLIANGEITLDGAITLTDPNGASAGLRKAPAIYNVDESSNVEGFYAALDPNNLTATFPYTYRSAGG